MLSTTNQQDPCKNHNVTWHSWP